jgi:ATP-dependent Clp protease ATP-binding subunit ClpC
LHAALRDDVVRHVLREIDADPEAIAAQVEEEADKAQRTDVAPSLSPDAKAALLAAYDESRELGASYVGPEHVLLALARDNDSEAGRLLERFGASHTKLRGGVIRGVEPTGGAREMSRTPRLDEYGRDLTQEAREGKLDPVIGRTDEIEPGDRDPLPPDEEQPGLLGEPGVGKTAIVEGIAQRIINDEVPRRLPDRRIIGLDLAGMIAGTKYRGEFEERLKTVIDEIRGASEELIVFIDELHTVVGAGAARGDGRLEHAQARTRPRRAARDRRDDARRVPQEHREGPALERRFQPVLVREPTVEETIDILHGLKDRYEAFHRVRISDEAIVAAAELSDRYIRDRFLPDKAIDLIDQASARVRLRTKTKDDDTRSLEEDLRRLARERDQATSPRTTSGPAKSESRPSRAGRSSTSGELAASGPRRSRPRTSPRWCHGRPASPSRS